MMTFVLASNRSLQKRSQPWFDLLGAMESFDGTAENGISPGYRTSLLEGLYKLLHALIY